MADRDTSLRVDYGIDTDSGSCSGILFEVPTTEVTAGMNVEIRLWGLTPESLLPYSIYKGTDSMGTGTMIDAPAYDVTPIVDFAETYEAQLEWPVHSITRVEAITEINVIDSSGNVVTWASRGEDVTSKFARKGYSCIKSLDGSTPLYGSIKVTYARAMYYKRWYWTVPAGMEGLHWFFIYKDNVSVRKFSIELPDLASTGAPVPRNIYLHVKDSATETNIANATVTVDGVVVGTTASDGILPLVLYTGEHTIFIDHPDYIDTASDSLSNDTFVVY